MNMTLDHFNQIERGWLTRLKGFSSSPRQEIFLVRFGLSDSEYLLLRTIKDVVVDWDSRHDRYELFMYDLKQLAFYTGWSEDKVYRKFKSLEKKGFIQKEPSANKVFRVTDLHHFKSLRDFSLLEDHELNYLPSYLEKIKAKVQGNSANPPKDLLNLQNELNKFLINKEDSTVKSSFSSKSSKSTEGYNNRSQQELNEDVSPEEASALMDK